MNIKQHFRDRIFFLIVLLFLIITIVASFYRFIIKNDYFVHYEGDCGPYIYSCFKLCEEDCTYYNQIQKYAPDIYSQCGKDITDCPSASICFPTDRKCSITFCDTNVDDNCETISENEEAYQPINNEIQL